MTVEEKQIIKDLFIKFKMVYKRQKINEDIVERIIRKLPPNSIPATTLARIEEADNNISEAELKTLEDRINRL